MLKCPTWFLVFRAIRNPGATHSYYRKKRVCCGTKYQVRIGSFVYDLISRLKSITLNTIYIACVTRPSRTKYPRVGLFSQFVT